MFDFLNQGISTVWGIAIIIVVSAIFVGLLQVYFSEISKISLMEIPVGGPASYNCESAYNNIEDDFKESNFCEKNSDCKTMEIGGMFVRFGCYKFVNINTNEQTFYDKMTEYYEKCKPAIDDCALSPEVICVDNKCVGELDLGE